MDIVTDAPMDTPSVTDPFAKLPVEMLLRITRHLPTTDLCNVRLVSRGTERALFHSFGHEFFRRKQFMFTDYSLQALIDISRHPELRLTLRHVSIGLDKLSNNLVQGFDNEDKAIQFQFAVAQQNSLLHTGRAVEMLSMAFANLPNLETIDIRDFNSHTRFRDGPSQPWRSYGFRHMQGLIGDAPGFILHDAKFASAAFSIILAALARAKERVTAAAKADDEDVDTDTKPVEKATVSPKNLEVLLRARHFGLENKAFDMTMAPGANPGPLLAVINGLQRLHLDVNFCQDVGFNNINVVGSRGGQFQPASIAGLSFHAFFAHASHIEWLRLNLQNSKHRRTDIFLSTLGKPLPESFPVVTSQSFTPMSASSDSTMPPKLHRLDLGHAEVSVPELLSLLRRIPFLDSLSLWNIVLVDPNQNPNTSNASTPPNVWNVFLSELAADPLAAQLRDFSIGNPRQLANTSTMYSDPVTFDGSSSSRHRAGLTEPMAKYLQTLAAIAKLNVTQVIHPDNDGDDDEEGDSEDEEHDGDEDDDDDDNDDDDSNAMT
ncbi:hypothetical protein Sste5346_001381 [Sporothrix stenoceras]|uniref:F-box domain-containing protein n=1 Tax=Sporothrix stenoceras TaxID=5173 RepID=A0ABR3ZP17_9PEZI